MWFAWALGCSALGDPRTLLTPDSERTGLDGTDGPYGAAVVDFVAQARVTEVLPITVVYPATEDLVPAVQNAPLLVLVHGGFVSPGRYEWLARHFATRGFVTVLPEAELLLAISQPGNGSVALAAVRDRAAEEGLLRGLVPPDGPAAAMGHSLGGVLAARQWVDDPSLDLLGMLASFPAASDDVESQSGRPVLSIVGNTDGGLSDIEDALDRYPGPADQWVVDGMNHYAWTEDPSEAEQARDGPLDRPLTDVRRDSQRVLDAFLDVYLTGADPALLEGPFPGTVGP